MWELDHKKSWVLKNWCFSTVVLEKTLESPLDCKEIKLVNPKGNKPWIFTGRTDAEAPIFGQLMRRPDSLEKTLMLRKIESRRRRGWQRMRWLDGITNSMDMRCGFNPWVRKILWRRKWQPTPIFLPGESHGQRSLMGYSPRGPKESDTTERLSMHAFIQIENTFPSEECGLMSYWYSCLSCEIISCSLVCNLVMAWQQLKCSPVRGWLNYYICI